MPKKKINTVTERDWEAEDYARTLMRAKEIQADPSKLKAASKAAVRLQKEKVDELAALKSVINKGKK